MGFSPAVTDLARCYTQGIGVPVDRQKAAQLYTRAAEDGDEEAMLWLGLWYRDESSQPDSQQWAQYWLQKAADNGSSRATEELKKGSGGGSLAKKLGGLFRRKGKN